MGNNDTDIAGLTSTFDKIHGELKGEIFETVYDGMNFAVYHGTSLAKKEQLIKSGKYDVFIYGHTHRKDNINIGTTIVINPGTAKGWIFGLFATIAVFDTSNRNLEFINLLYLQLDPGITGSVELIMLEFKKLNPCPRKKYGVF